MNTTEQKKYNKISARIASGEITDQKSWKMIKELNSFSEERLDSLAMISCTRKYTYRQMFRQWERYAEVFSALNITGKNRSRAGMLAAPAAESTFALYGLNMTGASVSMICPADALNMDRLEKMIRGEGITDLLLSDMMLQPELLRRLLAARSDLGLRNIIVLHWELTGPYIIRELALFCRYHYRQIKMVPGVVLMDDLLVRYEASPILYGPDHSEEAALILHTSGTTSGIHKPIPHSDLGFNESAARLLRDDRFRYLAGNARTYLGIDLSASFVLIDMLHLPLAFGGTVTAIPLDFYTAASAKAIKELSVNVMFGGGIMLPQMIHSPVRPDLSSLELCFIGGIYTSADKKRQYDEFLERCGSKARVTIGYGLSEAGGAVIIADPERTDDAIGRPLPGVKVKIFDEEEGKYYSPEDGPHTGVLFLSSPSVSSGRIDDKVFFTPDEIDGEQYLNTYDLVTVNEDGSLTCIGRANKYFVNNEGVRFDAGLVETAVSAQPGIISCGLAPVYDKALHDTVPVLYVHAEGNPAAAMRTARQSLLNVFIKDNKIVETNLPGKCVITNHIPLTPTGKVDVYAIIKKGVNGTAYMVKPIRRQDRLCDIGLVPVPQKSDRLASVSGIPDELDVGNELMQALGLFLPGLKHAPQSPGRQQGPMQPPFFGGMNQGNGPMYATPFLFPDPSSGTITRGGDRQTMYCSRKNICGSLRRELIRAVLERMQGMEIEFNTERINSLKESGSNRKYEVDKMLNIPYMNRGEVPLAMDIFRPVVPEGQELPVIITIHGGGLVAGDRSISRHLGNDLAGRGYLVFSLEYRLAPRANAAEQLDDICAGMDLVGRKLVDFEVDFTRIFLTAESAGAYLAIYVAAMKRSEKLQKAIGYEPTRMTFKALGLISGMFYTNRRDPIGLLLSEQFYGDKRLDRDFLQYMDPEHPEIIDNLPPVFLITSRGDFLNNYTLMYHKALKKAGKKTHLVYYGEKELSHAFASLSPDIEQGKDAIDRMLRWFEEQADAAGKDSAEQAPG
ncbi:MAG: AMP-binding protein [Lachnospiraceae bacterium]|nr:AMP-binding protein [Lachnospiraceae bacterium]